MIKAKYGQGRLLEEMLEDIRGNLFELSSFQSKEVSLNDIMQYLQFLAQKIDAISKAQYRK